MTFPPVSIRAVCVALLASTLATHDLQAAPARPPRDPLTALIEQGLPDVRGAQRVSVEYSIHLGTFGHPPGPNRKRVKENGWLLREERGGRLTLLLREARLVKARRATKGELDDRDERFEKLPAELPVVVVPIDLRAEIKRAAERWAVAKHPPTVPPDDPDAAEEREVSGVEMLRFLAHLQQLRQLQLPGAPALLARAQKVRTPARVRGDALNTLADIQLQNASDLWIETGDTRAHVAALDALVKQAPRDWERLDAVRLLAKNARENAGHPPENAAAELLMNLRLENIPELPLERNWLLRSIKGPAPWMAEEFDRQIAWEDRFIWVTPEKDEVAARTPVAAFFAQRLPVAKMLLALLQSRRPSRILHEGYYEDTAARWVDPAVGFPMFLPRAPAEPKASDSPAQRAQLNFPALYRTWEVREIARKLLEDVYPRMVFDDQPFEPLIAEWLRTLEGKSDDGIAWAYLEACDQPDDSAFGQALSVLLDLHAPESSERLQNLLCDPMIWSWPLAERLAPLLPAYLNSLGSRRGSFVRDLLTALKTGIDARSEESGWLADTGGETWGGRIKWEKKEGVRALRLVRLLTEQSTPLGLVNRYALLNGAEAEGVLDALRIAVPGHFDRELEAHLFQTAAKLEDADRRMQLLEIARHFRGVIPPGPPLDETTRAAFASLLADESDRDYGRLFFSRPAEMAQCALLYPRQSKAQADLWRSLLNEHEALGKQWLALAMPAAMEGKALPSVPAGVAFTGEEIAALVAPWQEWSGSQILAAARELPLETQQRLHDGLSRLPTWEAPLTRAQLTVQSVHEDLPAELRKLQGRVFDQKLRDEMAAIVRAAAADGRELGLHLYSDQILSGLELVVDDVSEIEFMTSRQKVRSYRLPGLVKRPPPDFAAIESLSSWRQGGRLRHEIGRLTPLWKDATVTASWLREAGGLPAIASGIDQSGFSNPRALAAMVSRIERGEAKLIHSFHFTTSASPIVDRDEK